jgi:hypothetical protein
MSKTQYGKGTREPSAGVVTRAVHGAGRLNAGTHDLEVLSVAEYPTHRVVMLQNPAGHVHAEPVEGLTPHWLVSGARVRVRIGLGQGFVCMRDVDRYQLRDAETKQPLTAWSADLAALYAAVIAGGVAPATTVLKEISHGDQTWVPTLHAPRAPHRAGDEQSGPVPPTDGGTGTPAG